MLDAAHDEQISEDELIGLVLGFSIVFTALQSRVRATLAKRRVDAVKRAKKEAQTRNDQALTALERSDPNTAAAVHDELWSDQTLPYQRPHPGVTYPFPGNPSLQL